jgi:hypothetical protein
LRLDYVRLAPGFARAVLGVYENWEGRESVPMKVKELMMVIEIEVNKLYDPGGWARVAAMPKPPKLSDSTLSSRRPAQITIVQGRLF